MCLCQTSQKAPKRGGYDGGRPDAKNGVKMCLLGFFLCVCFFSWSGCAHAGGAPKTLPGLAGASEPNGGGVHLAGDARPARGGEFRSSRFAPSSAGAAGGVMSRVLPPARSATDGRNASVSRRCGSAPSAWAKRQRKRRLLQVGKKHTQGQMSRVKVFRSVLKSVPVLWRFSGMNSERQTCCCNCR